MSGRRIEDLYVSVPSVLPQLGNHGVVPVVAIDSVETAMPLADALLEGGLPVVEVAFCTPAAPAAIEQLAKARPELIVGAGTLLTVENLAVAADCGAKFGTAPGLNPEIVAHAQEIGMEFVPGVATPSDIECGLSMGCKLLSFFPCQALGGLAMLRALAGPYGHTGVRFIPAGGVNVDNLADYLAAPIVAAVASTWIARRDDLADGNFHAIRDRCREAVDIVAQGRE